MAWISQVILLLVASSTCHAYLGFEDASCQNKQYGANCTLECFSTSPGQSISFKGKKIVDDDTYSLSRSGRMLIALVNKLTMDTVGKYTCSASGEASKDAQVTMSIKAVAPKSVYYLMIGSRSTVNTSVYGFPRPSAYTYKKKDGTGTYQTVAEYHTKTKVMPTGAGKYEINVHNAHLTILNVILSDVGDYQVSDGGTNQANFKLEVGSIPKITTKPASSYDVVVGVETTFKCGFEGSHKLTVTWIQTPKSGTPKTITKTSTGAVTLDGTNLKITPVLANKGDSFKCVGSSTFGEAFGKAEASTMISNVYTKPAINAMTNMKVNMGNKKDISCEATGGPNLVVSWMKKEKVGDFTEITGQVKSAGKSVYTIASAKVTDAGDYKCTAVISSKPELKDEATVSVSVLTPPMFDKVKSTSSLKYITGKGTKQTVTCVVDGNPVPTVKFMKGKVALSGTPNKTGMSVSWTVVYMANSTADGGKITCVANNSVNEVMHEITISVIDKLAPPTGLKAGKIGVTFVELQWDKVNGAKDYSVYMDDSIVKKPGSNMATIDTLAKGKAYKFAVSVNNEAGEGKRSAEISVTTSSIEKPTIPLPDPKQGPPKTFANNDVTFSWLKPANDGGDANLEYEVKYCEQVSMAYPPASCKTKKTKKTSITIDGLKEKTMYQFSVTAKNKEGAGKGWSFEAKTGAKTAPKPKPTSKPEKKPQDGGLSGGAIAGIIIAVILILVILIDLFCCYFNDCGFTHCCYQACCAGKSKGNYTSAGDSKDVEKAELKEMNDDEEKTDTKTAPEEKEDLVKEKKTEDV